MQGREIPALLRSARLSVREPSAGGPDALASIDKAAVQLVNQNSKAEVRDLLSVAPAVGPDGMAVQNGRPPGSASRTVVGSIRPSTEPSRCDGEFCLSSSSFRNTGVSLLQP